MAEFSNADRRAATRSYEGSESPSADGATKTEGNSPAGEASRCTPNAPSHGAASAGITDDERLDGDTPTPANPLLLSEAAGDVTTALVAKVTVSTPSPVSKGETAPLPAPVRSTSTPSSRNGGDPPMILTFGDFDEAAQVLSSDEYTTEPPSPGTAAAEDVGEGDDEDEADNAAPPLSPSSVDLSNDFPRLWDTEYVADPPTTAVESAESSPAPPIIAVGTGSDDGEAGAASPVSPATPDWSNDLSRLWDTDQVADHPATAVEAAESSPVPPITTIVAGFDDGDAGDAGPTTPATPDWSNDFSRLWDTDQVADHPSTAVESAESSPAPPLFAVGTGFDDGEAGDASPVSPATPDLAASFFLTLWGDMDPADSPVAATATSALPASTVGQPGRPATTSSRPSADIEASTPAPQQESCRQDTVTAPATASPSGHETTRVNGAVVGTPTLSAAALPFTPAASTTEPASATVGASTMVASCTRDGGQNNGVGGGAAEAVAATLPAGQVEKDAESRAELTSLTKSTLSATAKPFAPSTNTYTLEAASAARDAWKSNCAAVLAHAKAARADEDARMEREIPVYGTPEERREARHSEAAATAAAEAPRRPQGENQWSEVDALVEGVSIWRLSDSPSPSYTEQHGASQKYLANCLTAARKCWPSDSLDRSLHQGVGMLNLDGEIDNKNARCGRAAKHASTQAHLGRALERGTTERLKPDCIPSSTKVDSAFSGWLSQLTLSEPSTPCEEEARFLDHVTAQSSAEGAISALASDKRAHRQEKMREEADATREQKMLTLELQQREAIWQARAQAQAACQAHARHAEEEARATAALEQQEKALEEKRRQDLADAEAQRHAQQAAREQNAQIRACLDGARRRRAVRIRRAALAQTTEARAEKRSLYFPCSKHLRDLWRDRKVASRRCE